VSTEPLLTLEQTADFLGLSRSALYSLRYKGADLPPSYRLAGQVRYRRCEVDEWLDRQRETPRVVGA